MDFNKFAQYFQMHLDLAKNAKEGSDEALNPYAQDVLNKFIDAIQRGAGSGTAAENAVMGDLVEILSDSLKQAYSSPENMQGHMQVHKIVAPIFGLDDDDEDDEEEEPEALPVGEFYDRYAQLQDDKKTYEQQHTEKKSGSNAGKRILKFIAIAVVAVVVAYFFSPRLFRFLPPQVVHFLQREPSPQPVDNIIPDDVPSFEIIMEGTTFKTVSMAHNHAMAIDTNGNLHVWGENAAGQLGDGTTTRRRSPVIIMEGTTFSSISTNNRTAGAIGEHGHSMAIDTEGNLWAWGDNNHGQLGDGTTDNRLRPVKIMEGTHFSRVSTSSRHTLAIDTDGNLWAWGANCNGQLGDGTRNATLTPIMVKEGTTFAYVCAGTYASTGTGLRIDTAAIDTDGNLRSWGSNGTRQLETDAALVSVSAGSSYFMALDINGNLWAWGSNSHGQLDGARVYQSRVNRFDNPIMVMEDTVFTFVSTGAGLTTIAIDENGRISYWGFWNTGFRSIMEDIADMEFVYASMRVMARLRLSAIDANGNLWVTLNE